MNSTSKTTPEKYFLAQNQLTWQSAKFWACSLRDPISRQWGVIEIWRQHHSIRNEKLFICARIWRTLEHFLNRLKHKNRFLAFLPIFGPTRGPKTVRSSSGMRFKDFFQGSKNYRRDEGNQMVNRDFDFEPTRKPVFFRFQQNGGSIFAILEMDSRSRSALTR